MAQARAYGANNKAKRDPSLLLPGKIGLLVFSLSIASILATELTTQQKWNNFKLTYKKNYNSPIEERTRYAVFQNNLDKIDAHNEQYRQGLTSWYMGVNQFTDMTDKEFQSTLTLTQRQTNENKTFQSTKVPHGVKIPQELNWVEKGAVTPVKDQGDCGSCWSFSTTGSLEGQYFIKYGKLVSLSEQNLIDCSTEYGNYGCMGGLMDYAFAYVRDYGIMTEERYPYIQSDGICTYVASQSVLKVASFVDVRLGSEAQLRYALATIGPVSIGINADYFNSYAGGILDNTSCDNERMALDHGVLVVGYGSENGNDYWLVKNSWGPAWGEKGYIRIARNKNNMCGIATDASYPLIQ